MAIQQKYAEANASIAAVDSFVNADTGIGANSFAEALRSFASTLADEKGRRLDFDARKLRGAIPLMHYALTRFSNDSVWADLAAFIKAVKPSGLLTRMIRQSLPTNAKVIVSKGEVMIVAHDGESFNWSAESTGIITFIGNVSDSIRRDPFYDPAKDQAVKDAFPVPKETTKAALMNQLAEKLGKQVKALEKTTDATLTDSELIAVMKAALKIARPRAAAEGVSEVETPATPAPRKAPARRKAKVNA